VRTCAQCGLSIGQSVTFCAVCGAQGDALLSSSVTETTVVAWATSADDVATAATAAPAAPPPVATDGVSRRLAEISRTLRDAERCERDDPPRAAESYRTAILAYLEVTDDPLGSEEARRGLMRSFDRLSLVLQRAGLGSEALEQIELAASLGLLDSRDERTEGYRAALRKRRVSLRGAEAVAARASS
jgi:hypothetical protein